MSTTVRSAAARLLTRSGGPPCSPPPPPSPRRQSCRSSHTLRGRVTQPCAAALGVRGDGTVVEDPRCLPPRFMLCCMPSQLKCSTALRIKAVPADHLTHPADPPLAHRAGEASAAPPHSTYNPARPAAPGCSSTHWICLPSRSKSFAIVFVMMLRAALDALQAAARARAPTGQLSGAGAPCPNKVSHCGALGGRAAAARSPA
jgi:hypothetical protein